MARYALPTTLLAAALLVLLASRARAQAVSDDTTPSTGAAPPVTDGGSRSPAATPDVPDSNPPAAAPSSASPPTVPTEPIAPAPGPSSFPVGAQAAIVPTREQQAQRSAWTVATTVGMPATAPDLGGEADLVSTADEKPVMATRSLRWRYGIQAYMRASVSIGYGPRNDGAPGHEWHSEARVPGSRSNQWNYTGLTPPTITQLLLMAENAKIGGYLFIEAASLGNAGYENLLKIGGISDAYVTLKFPAAFGQSGGFALNLGAFSHRYGVAGPRQSSTGYYGTYLFGRLRVAGEDVTADIRLGENVDFLLEDGFGAKLEVMPFTASDHSPPPPVAAFLPYQGPVPQGSNFVHHAHAALVVGDSLRIAGHYMTSWTPDDWRSTGEAWQRSMTGLAPTSRITATGGEIHFDDAIAGNGYVGYSHVSASNVLPLSNGIELIHSRYGYELADNYFGPLPSSFATAVSYVDSGTIDTLLTQYIFRLAPLLGYPRGGLDLGVALYAMYNVVDSNGAKHNRLKFGADVEASLHRNVALGVRFDQVMPNGTSPDTQFSAISPRLILHSNYLAREYIMLNYTMYSYGPSVVPGVPYSDTQKPDPSMFLLSAVVSF